MYLSVSVSSEPTYGSPQPQSTEAERRRGYCTGGQDAPPYHPLPHPSCLQPAVIVTVRPSPSGPGKHPMRLIPGDQLREGRREAGLVKCPPQGQAGHPCSCLPTSPSPGLALPCSGPCKCGVTPDKVTIAAWPGCGLPPARLKMAPAGHWAASGGCLRGGQGCGLGRRRSAQLFLVTGPLSPQSFFPLPVTVRSSAGRWPRSSVHCPLLLGQPGRFGPLPG